MKKILSSILAATTIACANPMAFAEWKVVGNGCKMKDFTKLPGQLSRKNWCWLSCSMKLIDYWSSQFDKPGLNMTELFNKINDVLEIHKLMGITFTALGNVYANEDTVCSGLANSKGIELLLNEKLNSKKFFYFYVDAIMRRICRPEQESKGFIDEKDVIFGYNASSYELVERIIDRFECPFVASIVSDGKGGFIKKSEFTGFGSPIIGHMFLISAIDKETKKIRLENPNPTELYPQYIDISQEDFNECCFSFFGVVNDLNFFDNIR